MVVIEAYFGPMDLLPAQFTVCVIGSPNTESFLLIVSTSPSIILYATLRMLLSPISHPSPHVRPPSSPVLLVPQLVVLSLIVRSPRFGRQSSVQEMITLHGMLFGLMALSSTAPCQTVKKNNSPLP